MINKEKVMKIDVYDQKKILIAASKVFSFPKELFKSKNQVSVSVKCTNMRTLKKNEPITVIFEYVNGTRVQCQTTVDAATRIQIDFHAGNEIELEERRASFKITTNEPAEIVAIERNYSVSHLEEFIKAKILNINLGGVLMKTGTAFEPKDVVYIRMFKEDPVEIRTEILRKQMDANGNLVGYGCKFTEVTQQEEERLARYIFECQVAERERKRNEEYFAEQQQAQ